MNFDQRLELISKEYGINESIADGNMESLTDQEKLVLQKAQEYNNLEELMNELTDKRTPDSDKKFIDIILKLSKKNLKSNEARNIARSLSSASYMLQEDDDVEKELNSSGVETSPNKDEQPVPNADVLPDDQETALGDTVVDTNQMHLIDLADLLMNAFKLKVTDEVVALLSSKIWRTMKPDKKISFVRNLINKNEDEIINEVNLMQARNRKFMLVDTENNLISIIRGGVGILKQTAKAIGKYIKKRYGGHFRGEKQIIDFPRAGVRGGEGVLGDVVIYYDTAEGGSERVTLELHSLNKTKPMNFQYRVDGDVGLFEDTLNTIREHYGIISEEEGEEETATDFGEIPEGGGLESDENLQLKILNLITKAVKENPYSHVNDTIKKLPHIVDESNYELVIDLIEGALL